MSRRAVYDTMIFFQWATLPADEPRRIHGTLRALLNHQVRLCVSKASIEEVRKVLADRELPTLIAFEQLLQAFAL